MLKNEIAIMSGLVGNYDIINIHEKKCYFEYVLDTIHVLVEVD